jgi:photosystem II stability/assembly factor-like uncharacterized protein
MMRTTLLAVLLVAASARAQVGPWVDVGPAGGRASIVAVDGTNANVAYAVVGDTVWKTTNGGDEWTAAAPLPTTDGAGVLLGLTTDGSTVYASTEDVVRGSYGCHRLNVCEHRYVVAKSTDGGATWGQVYEDIVTVYPTLGYQQPGAFLAAAGAGHAFERFAESPSRAGQYRDHARVRAPTAAASVQRRPQQEAGSAGEEVRCPVSRRLRRHP